MRVALLTSTVNKSPLHFGFTVSLGLSLFPGDVLKQAKRGKHVLKVRVNTAKPLPNVIFAEGSQQRQEQRVPASIPIYLSSF